MKVYQAINAVQKALSGTGLSKDRMASGFGAGYAFRGIDDLYNALSPLLAEHGLVIIPRCVERHESQRMSGPKTLYFVVVKMEFDFISSEDGTKHTACTFGEAMDSGDKATNKAMSIAYKYACFQTFAIPTEGDNDPDATIHEPAPARKPQPKQQPNMTDKQILEALSVAPNMEKVAELWAIAVNMQLQDKLKPDFTARKAQLTAQV